MHNNFFIVIVSLVLTLSIYIGAYALFKSQSYKRNYFLLMQVMVIIYLIGYLMELSSTNAEEAYAGVKVLYIGASFVTVFAFFLMADYCNIRLHPVFIKAPMLLMSLASVIIMWTTKFHHLVYTEYYYVLGHPQYLAFKQGPLYSVLHAYPTLCMILSMGLLLFQMKKWEKKFRRQLLILLVCHLIPFIGEGIYYLSLITEITKNHFYITPYSMAIMSFLLYLGVMRFNIFEIISIATVTAMEHFREGFILVDVENNFLSHNPSAVKMIPGIAKLLKGEQISAARGWPAELRQVESGSVDFSINEGETRYIRASISPVIAENQTLIAKILLFSDITDNVNLLKELENAAYIDSLTGLYNRKHFSELAGVDIERALRLNQSIYMAMLDLDHFKNVNDTFGHAAGDMVLKSTAGITRQTIRSYDLLGRYGGEEFVLLLTALEETEAYKLVERIRENMEHNVVSYEGKEIRCTCSIGLAKFLKTDTIETSLRKADEALYSAKNSGRNKVMIYG